MEKQSQLFFRLAKAADEMSVHPARPEPGTFPEQRQLFLQIATLVAAVELIGGGIDSDRDPLCSCLE